MLQEIIEHYQANTEFPVSQGKVALYALVADELSKYGARPNPWSWRYVQGVASGRMEPSRYMRQAIEVLHAEINGTPPLAPARVCPVHGEVHDYDCRTHLPRPRKTGGRRYPPRLAIRKDDMRRAARAIIGNFPEEDVARLSDLLAASLVRK